MAFLPDATDFTDITLRDEPSAYRPGQTFVLCPKCHGHGMWNLTRDAYGPGRHFQAACGQCNGWGWVAGSLDATCVHVWRRIAPSQPFRCWFTDQCIHCGRTVSGSSDD